MVVPRQECFCTPKVFDIHGFQSRYEQEDQHCKGFKSKGHCFDDKNHNWMILMEFLCLPFSFLTFAILEKIENREPNENVFDPEPYNYVFNRSTSFLDGWFVQHDHLHLNHVLSELEK